MAYFEHCISQSCPNKDKCARHNYCDGYSKGQDFYELNFCGPADGYLMEISNREMKENPMAVKIKKS